MMTNSKAILEKKFSWILQSFLFFGGVGLLFSIPMILAILGVWIENRPLDSALRAEAYGLYGLKRFAGTDYESALARWKPRKRIREKPPTPWKFNFARLHNEFGNFERVDELLQSLNWDKSTLNNPSIPIQKIPSRTIQTPHHD